MPTLPFRGKGGDEEAGLKSIFIDEEQYTVYCKDGYTGGIGSGNEDPGWFKVDTCGKSWNQGPNKDDCMSKLNSASKRAAKELLPWYNTFFAYEGASAFHQNGQQGVFLFATWPHRSNRMRRPNIGPHSCAHSRTDAQTHRSTGAMPHMR